MGEVGKCGDVMAISRLPSWGRVTPLEAGGASGRRYPVQFVLEALACLEHSRSGKLLMEQGMLKSPQAAPQDAGPPRRGCEGPSVSSPVVLRLLY